MREDDRLRPTPKPGARCTTRSMLPKTKLPRSSARGAIVGSASNCWTPAISGSGAEPTKLRDVSASAQWRKSECTRSRSAWGASSAILRKFSIRLCPTPCSLVLLREIARPCSIAIMPPR